jgi:hypothetical protein
MIYMNRYDIDNAVQQYGKDTVLGKAARFLADYRVEVDANSDGWAYWHAPVKAASKLIQMFDHPTLATEAEFKRALTPIRSFYTKIGLRAGMKFPTVLEDL